MILTRDNYYSLEADREYMSCSQYQKFQECEAKAMAILEGRWVEEEREAFLVGNYFHTAFESEEAHHEFILEHEDVIFKKAKKAAKLDDVPEKYAPYAQADQMIEVARKDPLIRSLIDMPGENEKIMTGKIYGVPWRIRLDKYVPDGRLIIDWKTCADINELRWSDAMREKVSFIDAFSYMMRAAVYTEVERQNAQKDADATFLIVAISKQKYPDKDVFMLNHRSRYDYELAQIKEKLPYFQAIKEGHMVPKRCGCCDYCRSTKVLQEIKPYYVLMPEFRGEKDDEYSSVRGQVPVLDNAPTAGGMDNVPAVPEADPVGAPLE